MKWLPRIENAAEMMAIARGDFSAIEKLINEADVLLNKTLRKAASDTERVKAQGVAEFIEELKDYFDKATDWATGLYEQEAQNKRKAVNE